jgi:hypothetical protein
MAVDLVAQQVDRVGGDAAVRPADRDQMLAISGQGGDRVGQTGIDRPRRAHPGLAARQGLGQVRCPALAGQHQPL